MFVFFITRLFEDIIIYFSWYLTATNQILDKAVFQILETSQEAKLERNKSYRETFQKVFAINWKLCIMGHNGHNLSAFQIVHT